LGDKGKFSTEVNFDLVRPNVRKNEKLLVNKQHQEQTAASFSPHRGYATMGNAKDKTIVSAQTTARLLCLPV
jgi:hypothetical protein